MKPRHAAALVLVGWYLMLPPKSGSRHAPLSMWRVAIPFDNARECEQQIVDEQKDTEKTMHGPDWKEWTAEQRATIKQHADDWDSAQCIATDDPRLAK